MTEVKLEGEKVRGFAGIIENVFKPINEKEKFKEKFGKINVKILINAVNLNYAALIIIENGTLSVKSVRNRPKENLTKSKLGWDALLEMDSQTFLAFSMKRLSLPDMAKKWLTGKIKMKGIRKLLVLMKVLALLNEESS